MGWYFKASLIIDRNFIMVGIFIVIGIYILAKLSTDPREQWFCKKIPLHVAVALVLFVFTIFSYLGAHKGYSINKSSISIHKNNWTKIVIPISKIKGIKRLNDYRGCRRIIDGQIWYVSEGRNIIKLNKRKLVLLELENGDEYLLSPDDPERFISLLKQLNMGS